MKSAESLSSSTGLIFLLNIFGGIGLRQVWKAVNILQFIIYADDWKISPPSNLQVFFSQGKYFARGEWIPKEAIMEWAHIKQPGEEGNPQVQQTMFLLLVIAVCGLLAVIILSVLMFMKKCTYCRTLNHFIDRQKKWVIWNGCIRALLQSYLEFAITVAAMYLASTIEGEELSAGNWIRNAVCTILLLAVPAVLYMFLSKIFYGDKINDPKTVEKFGTLWTGMNTQNFYAIQYFTVFLIRRIAFAFISIYMGPVSGGLVLITVCYVSLGIQVSYLLQVRPNKNKREQYLEVISEVLLLYFFYGVLVDEMATDPVIKFHVAWGSVVCFCALFLVNIGNIVAESVTKNYAYLKALYIAKYSKAAKEAALNKANRKLARKSQSKGAMNEGLGEIKEASEREENESEGNDKNRKPLVIGDSNSAMNDSNISPDKTRRVPAMDTSSRKLLGDFENTPFAKDGEFRKTNPFPEKCEMRKTGQQSDPFVDMVNEFLSNDADVPVQKEKYVLSKEHIGQNEWIYKEKVGDDWAYRTQDMISDRDNTPSTPAIFGGQALDAGSAAGSPEPRTRLMSANITAA